MSDEAKKVTKPKCRLIGENGNVFNLIGIARNTLRRAGQAERGQEMSKRITETAKSYDEALEIIGEYVDIV
jgi:hypothetical protein